MSKWERRKARQRYMEACTKVRWDRRHRNVKLAEARIRWDMQKKLTGR